MPHDSCSTHNPVALRVERSARMLPWFWLKTGRWRTPLADGSAGVQTGSQHSLLRGTVFCQLSHSGASVIAACCIGHCSTLHRPSQCAAHCSALRWACDISARFVVPVSRLAFALMAGSHDWLQMRWRCFMMRQGSVPGRVEQQGGNENGTCQLVMARPMMIGYRGMSIPRWRILVSGSWHRWRGQASVCVR